MLHEFFQKIKLGSGVERQKLELLDKLDRAFPCAEEQIYEVTVEIIVNIHAADFRLHSHKQCSAATKGFEIELWALGKHLPDMLEYLLQFEDPLEVARDRWIFEQGADHGDEFQHALESLRQEDHAEQNYPLDEAYAQNQKNEMTMQL